MRLNIYKLMMLIILVSSSVLSQRMSVQDFHNFTRDQQVETIQSMQMFAVNIEQMHLQKMRRKYSYQTLQILLDAIVTKSVAQKVINNNKLCIYAGWLSYIPKNAGKNGFCTHPNNINMAKVPSKLKEVIKKEQQRYNKFKKEFTPTGCSNPKMIMCNPQLFGHNPGETKPFCVDGNSNSENSSFQCLKAVEIHKEKEAVLDLIIEENLKDDKAQRLQRLMGMIDDACMCESPDNLIDQGYAKRMYKTQTCFSWVSQVRNISKRVCQTENKTGKDLSSILSLSKNLYRKAKSELLETGISDTEYTKIIEAGKWSNSNWKERRDTYKDYCSEIKEPIVLDEVLLKTKKYAIEIKKGEIVEGLQVINASPTIDGNEIPKDEIKNYTVQWFQGDTPIKSTPKNDRKILVDPKKIKSPIKAKLVKNGKEKALSNEIDLANPYSISIADTDKDKEGKNLVATVKKDGKELTLDQLKDYSINWFLKGKEDKPFDQSSISFNTTKFKATKTEDNIVYATLTEVDKKLAESNKLEYKKDEDLKEDYKISIEKKSMQGDKQNLIAKVTLDGKEITVEDLKKDGLSIKWAEILASKKDEAKKDEDKTEEDTEETKDKKIVDADEDGIPDDLVTKNEDDKDDSEPKTEIDKNGFQTFVENTDSFEAQAEVFKEKKIVIAKLIKNKKEITSSNEVDFKKSVTAPYQGRQTPQILQPIMGPLLNLGGVR